METWSKKKHASPSPPHKRILEHAEVWSAGGLKSEKLLTHPVEVHIFFSSLPTPSCPLPSSRQFLDGLVVVLRDGGSQGVPVVGVQLNDLQQQGPRQHGLGGTQHLVTSYRQQLRHHLRQLLLQQTAAALQLSGEEGVNHGIVILMGPFHIEILYDSITLKHPTNFYRRSPSLQFSPAL